MISYIVLGIAVLIVAVLAAVWYFRSTPKPTATAPGVASTETVKPVHPPRWVATKEQYIDAKNRFESFIENIEDGDKDKYVEFAKLYHAKERAEAGLVDSTDDKV